jgi:hypothetical protein
MRRVWGQLTKQRRKKYLRTGEPLHKVTERFASIGIDEQAAAVGLLEHAFNQGRLTLMLPQADRPDRPLEAAAKVLRDFARRQRKDRAGQARAKRYQAAADTCAGITLAAYDPAKAIAGEIARFLQSVFGSPMYKTTAIIASVITECEITDREVRTWVKALSHPAKNA